MNPDTILVTVGRCAPERTTADIAAAAQNVICAGGNALVALRTPRTALETYREIYAEVHDQDIEVMFLESAAALSEQKQEWLLEHYGPQSAKRPHKSIVVTDVATVPKIDTGADFDVAVIDAAPLAQIRQLAEYVHRTDLPERSPYLTAPRILMSWPYQNGEPDFQSETYKADDLCVAFNFLEKIDNEISRHNGVAN